MTLTANPPAAGNRAGLKLASPFLWLAVAMALVVVLLALPLSLPIGPLNWDVYIYYDAANRIAQGQAPILDFFTPVGPLGYYLFAGWLAVFPDAQPALIATFSLLAVSAPLMALVIWDVQKRSNATALLILLPFLLFSLLPFNSREIYPLTGVDAYGIYNRQICHILYVLVAALTFVRDRRLLAVIVALSMTAMFFLKITGFVAGGMIAAFAFLWGRLPFRYALGAAIGFIAILAGLELTTGIVSAYVNDILVLISRNSGTLAPRFLYAISQSFGMLAAAGLLALGLLWSRRTVLTENVRNLAGASKWRAAQSLLAEPALWLLAVAFAGVFFETQNTGSQPLIFLLPVVLAIVLKLFASPTRLTPMMTCLALAAAVALPPMVGIVERAGRVLAGGMTNVALNTHNLRALGQVTLRPEVAKRASLMAELYPRYRPLYQELAEAGEQPTALYYSDLDMQAGYLIEADKAIDAVRALEVKDGLRFETIAALSFVNPFPWLMDRSAPKNLAIGAVPDRSMPAPGPKQEAAMTNVDLALLPTCPPTAENLQIYTYYEPALKAHKRIKLTECYDAFIGPALASKLTP